LSCIADCLRLPRGGFARRIGKDKLDDLDRALGKKPDFRDPYKSERILSRVVEFTQETMDRAVFAEALRGIVASFERALRQSQMQLKEVELEFLYLHAQTTRTRIRFVDPVHRSERILSPLLARIERMVLAGPAVGLALKTGILQPFETETAGLLPLAHDQADANVPEYALVEHLRGRFGMQSVYGIDRVAEHRPEYAWRRCIDKPKSSAKLTANCPRHERPLWLLSKPEKKRKKRGQTPESDPEFERIESGWWDGHDVRRDYYVVIGADGEKLWFYRDCQTEEWYLHGIFG